ncbi:MAG: PKD domain-containing protein [Bacteroidetes bacterium]|nr:PKD domain-containing protein [Bacteroidota bacterium]
MKKFTNYFKTLCIFCFSAATLIVNAQAPSNDLICGATPISVGIGCTQSTNVNATITGSPAAATCWAPNNASNDVWFSFVATTVNMTVSTDASGLTLTNTQVAIYSSSTNNCTGTLTLVGCGENGGTNVANNSITDLSLVPGNTYFIRVDGNGTATGTFCVSAYDTYTPGSTPCEAQIVSPNSATCATTAGNLVTNSTVPAVSYPVIGVDYGGCDNETSQFGVWNVFTANSTSVTLTNRSGGGRDYTLFSGPCSSLTWISCTSIPNNNGTTLFSGLTVGTDYYLLTTLSNGATTAPVVTDLCVTNTIPCTPPTNNTCATAMSITANTLYNVTNYCATADQPPALCSGTLQNNIWFNWTTPVGWTGQAYFQLFEENCRSGATSQGMQCSVYQNTVVCGGTANCVATSNTITDNNVNVVWTPVPGTTYLINYDGYSGEVCNMNFEITNTAAVVVISVNSPVICLGESVVLTATSNATGYLWSTGQSGSSITVSPTVTTSYTVSATAGGTGSAVATVTVNPIPAAPTLGSNSPVCEGSTLDLTASTIANATYSWTGPNNFSSTQQNPSIASATVAASGTYTVTDTLLGCGSLPAHITVVVNEIPPAPQASSNSSICSGDTLRLFASTVANVTYSWTGPNGFTSSAQNPVIVGATAADAGTYSVTTTRNGCTSPAATTTVVINAIPSTTAGSNSPLCAGGTLNLTATNVSGGSFTWTGPNGFTSNQQNPSVANTTVADAGTYTVNVTAAGCGSAQPSSTVVVINPVNPPVASSNSPICAGNTLNLAATTIAGATYAWTGPNGFVSNQQNPSISNATVAASGTYSVVATVSGCSSSSPATTDVVVNPIPGVTAGSNSPVCAGSDINLTATTFAGATYSWTGPGGFTSTLQNPTITNATVGMSGTYTVTSSANGCSGGAPSSTTVVVNPVTPPVAGSNSPLCEGATLNLTASFIVGATYAWTGPNGFTSTLQNPSITPVTVATAGVYSVIANVSGCNSSVPATTTVVVNPVPTITASSNSPICAGGTLNLTATTFAGAIYSWTGPNGFASTLQNPFINNATTAASGIYFVAASAGGCTSNTAASTTVVVNPIPSAPTASSNSPICEGATLNLAATTVANASYTWQGPNGFFSNVQNPSIGGATLAAAGTYIFRVTVNGCVSPAATTVVVINGTPVAPTASSNSPVCEGSTILLTASTIPGGTYSWTGPNGFTSSSQNPSVPNATFANGGTYFVFVTVNGCTGITATTVVTVNKVPAAPTATSNSPVCVGGTLLLFASTIPNATYVWTDPIGFTNPTQNPVVPNISALVAGVYSVVATVNGCSSLPATTLVVISPVPTATFTSTAPVCVGTGVDFTNSGSTGVGYTFFWDFGPGSNPPTSTLENPTGITYSSSGPKTVTLTVTGPGCSTTDSAVINITTVPLADFTTNGPVCSFADPVIFTDASTGTITSYFWDFGPGATPATSTSAGPITVVYSSNGTKTVMLTVTSGACTNTTTKTVDVGVVGADFTSSSPPGGDGGCLGNGENFYNIGSSGSGALHFWNFGAGATPATSTLENPTDIVYATSGAKIVTHTVTVPLCGLTETITHIITINPSPAASFTSSASACANGPVDFTNTGSTGVGFSYFWDFGAGTPVTSVAENPTGIIYATSGTKVVTLSVTNEFYCVTLATQTIIIGSTPVASFASTAPQCTGSSVDFTNTGTSSGVSWSWNFGGGATPATDTVQNPTGVVYSTPGVKVVTLTVGNAASGCSATATNTILIHQTPVASFTSTAPQCAFANVDFTNTGSTGGNWSYDWNLGQDGIPFVASSENITGVIYRSSGIKTVTFTISDQNCSNTISQDILINETPTARFTSTAPVCTGQAVDFANTGTSGGVTFSWNFGAGSNPSLGSVENPTGIVYSTPGVKLVQLSVTNVTTGCVANVTNTIVIHETPTVTFTSTAPQCAGTGIDFTNTGSTGGGWAYVWSFGQGADPSGSSAENPLGIEYNSGGTKTVTLTISNQNCTQTSSQTIVVNETPTASFTSTVPVCTGLPLNFTNTGTTAGVTWSWDFGAGATPATSTDQNPTGIVYANGGIKIVTLTTTNTATGCSATATVAININQGPTATFTSTAPQCANSPVDFTNTGSTGGNWSYSWNLGQGANPGTSTAENPTGILYSSAGTKTVTFTISDQNCTQTSTQTIVINETPVVSFTSAAPQCTGLPVNFNNTGTSTGVTWSWNFGSGANPATDTVQNPVVIYSTAGIKTVTLTTTNTATGCAVTATNTVNINQTPTATFSSTAPQCANTGIDFTNTGSTGGNWSYTWTFGQESNPAMSSAENPTGITYSTSGTKTVTFTISDQNCTQTSTQTIVVNETPAASFTSTAPQCTGLNVDFTNTGTTSAGVTWAWDFGSGATPATSTDSNPTGVVYSTAGIKTVTLTITNTTSGCAVTATSTIKINLTPTSTFTSTAPQCANTAIDFTNTGSTGSNWSYTWTFGVASNPSTSSAENPSGITYGIGGTKTVTFTIADQNCTNTSSQVITINETPTASFTSTAPQCTGLGVDFTNTGTATGVTWTWNFGSGASPVTSTDENPTGIVYSTSGIKTVTLITTNSTTGCSSTVTNTLNIHQSPTATFTSTAPQCANSGVDFVNTGSTGSNWSYNWNFGLGANPATSVAENPTGITYSSSGTKTVSFTISDQNCTQTSTQTITIDETPVANFTSTAPQCTGLPVNFTNTGTVTGVTWAWTFGSGATPASSTDENPTGVVYSTAGTKFITMTTTNTVTGCISNVTGTININQTPTATFSSNAPQCVSSAINFTNTGSTGSSWNYSWTFGQDAVPAVSTSENPGGVLYTSAGTKTVTFTISDANCVNTSTQTIDVNALPVADAGADVTICANRTAQLGSPSIAGNTYNWFPSTTLSNPFISDPSASPVASVTTYLVQVVNTASGCSNTDQVTVTMLPPLHANAGPDVEICDHESVQIGAALIEGQFYSWTPTTGLSDPTSPKPIANPSVTTTYTLQVTDTVGCDFIADDVTVVVHPLPMANAGADDTIGKGASIQLIGTGGIQYFWTPVTGLNNANIFNPIASPDSSTDYVLTVTDLFGCVNTDTVNIHVFGFTEPYWLPSAFSPNGDGHNDVLYVRGSKFLTFDFSIYNRYGELIFVSKDINVGWDGNSQYTGDEMPSDAYVYKVDGVVAEDGTVVKAKGLVNLVR